MISRRYWHLQIGLLNRTYARVYTQNAPFLPTDSLCRHVLCQEQFETSPQEIGIFRNIGPIEKADGYGKIIGICGDAMEFWVRIEDGILRDVRYVANGCISTRLCAGAVAFLAEGEPIEKALLISAGGVLRLVKDVSGVDQHCAILAVSTFYRAIAEHLLKSHSDHILKELERFSAVNMNGLRIPENGCIVPLRLLLIWKNYWIILTPWIWKLLSSLKIGKLKKTAFLMKPGENLVYQDISADRLLWQHQFME